MVTNFNEACEQLTNEMWALTEKESPIGPVVDGIINVIMHPKYWTPS